MDRPLSYLSDEALSTLLSAVCDACRRRGAGYVASSGHRDAPSYWQGPQLSTFAWNIIEEYVARNRSKRPCRKSVTSSGSFPPTAKP